MSRPIALVAFVALMAGSLAGVQGAQAGRHDAAATAALEVALQQRITATVQHAAAPSTYDDAVRVGPALVPARITVWTAPGGASSTVHGTVRATGPGGVPVVASARSAAR